VARGFDLQKLDFLVAGVLAAASVAVAASTRHSVPAVAFGILGAATVASRRRAPVVSVLGIAAATILLGVIDNGVDETTQGVAAALCFYILGRTGNARAKGTLDLALLALGVGAVAATRQRAAVDVAATWLVFVLLPYLGGRTAEGRRGLTKRLEANAEQARREQEARARAAATEERTRIARELHDVVAHSLSVMVIQTAGAREVARTDSESARAALSAVQQAGREALLEMRRMIGVLRRGDVELAGSTAPGLDQLDLLAQRARMAGLPVELRIDGSRRRLPEALDLVAFRIVQEALTNSIKHAGSAQAAVTVTFGAAELELEICDDGWGAPPQLPAGADGGHGLVGMRERLALFDGELSTGPRTGGGFRVHARLPLDEAVAA
jgi:signal transduction histidine kinase